MLVTTGLGGIAVRVGDATPARVASLTMAVAVANRSGVGPAGDGVTVGGTADGVAVVTRGVRVGARVTVTSKRIGVRVGSGVGTNGVSVGRGVGVSGGAPMVSDATSGSKIAPSTASLSWSGTWLPTKIHSAPCSIR